MSRRPTTKAKHSCATTSSSNNNYGYAPIGDTVAATLYAQRLQGNNVPGNQITLINEGFNNTSTPNVQATDFIPENSSEMKVYLNSQIIRYHPAPDDPNVDDDEDTCPTHGLTNVKQTVTYYYGAGPLGDFITAYIIPRVGPWFNLSNHNNRFLSFIKSATMQLAQTSNEKIVTANLLKIYSCTGGTGGLGECGCNNNLSSSGGCVKLVATDIPIVDQPSILTTNYVFTQMVNNTLTRQLFLNTYRTINAKGSVYKSQVKNFFFHPLTPGGPLTVGSPVNITAASNGGVGGTGQYFSLSNVLPQWKTNPYTYLRLANNAGIKTGTLEIPTFYRAVLSIPELNSVSGVDLRESGATGRGYLGDWVTSYVSFSLPDMSNLTNENLGWMLQAYTTVEDFASVTSGAFAATGSTLLIIEGISTTNLRATNFNTPKQHIHVNYNDRCTESNHLSQFTSIVSNVYKAYTGATIDPNTLLFGDMGSVCQNNTCYDSNIISDVQTRESPMTTVLLMSSVLYNSGIYPNPSKCS